MAIYKRGASWYIDCYCEGRRLRKKVGPNKRMAEQALAVQTAEILQGRYHFNIHKNAIRFNELTDQYMEHAKATKLSWCRDGDFVKRFQTVLSQRCVREFA